MARKKDETTTDRYEKTREQRIKQLEPYGLQHRTTNEQRMIASMGGKASGEARRAVKSFRESMLQICTGERKDKINEKIVQLAERGNLDAVKLAMRILGEDITTDVNDNDAVKAFVESLKK